MAAVAALAAANASAADVMVYGCGLRDALDEQWRRGCLRKYGASMNTNTPQS